MNTQDSGWTRVQLHYSRPEVLDEVIRFSNGRWIGIHTSARMKDGRPILLRYFEKRPLKAEDVEGLKLLLNRFRRLGPRTIYATANVYARLEDEYDVKSPENVIACMPTWDIDNSLQGWRATVDAGREIYAFLESQGVRSVILKWSGNGMHVHVHHNAFSLELYREKHPLDIAYAVVEYVRRKLATRFEDIREMRDCRELTVDNEMDPQRLFTAPLSLHRELDLVAVVINPDEIDSFEPSFANADNFRHFRGWDSASSGEADGLAEEALKIVGGYPLWSYPQTRRRGKRIEDEIRKFQYKLGDI
jgi:hypothetical protein